MAKLVAVLLLSFFSSSLLNGQILKINVKKGSRYQIESTSTIITTSDQPGADGSETSSKVTAVYEVTDVDKDGITLEYFNTRFIFSMKDGMMDTSYDSNDPHPGTGPGKIGKKYKVKIDGSGKIIKKDDDDEDVDTKAPFDFSSAGSDKAGAGIFRNELLGKEMKTGNSFPFADSVTSEKGTTSFSLNKDKMDFRANRIYTIADTDSGMVKFTITGDMSMNMTMTLQSQNFSNISIGTLTGELKLDMETGTLLSERSVTEMDNTSATKDHLTKSKLKMVSEIIVTPLK